MFLLKIDLKKKSPRDHRVQAQQCAEGVGRIVVWRGRVHGHWAENPGEKKHLKMSILWGMKARRRKILIIKRTEITE